MIDHHGGGVATYVKSTFIVSVLSCPAHLDSFFYSQAQNVSVHTL